MPPATFRTLRFAFTATTAAIGRSVASYTVPLRRLYRSVTCGCYRWIPYLAFLRCGLRFVHGLTPALAFTNLPLRSLLPSIALPFSTFPTCLILRLYCRFRTGCRVTFWCRVLRLDCTFACIVVGYPDFVPRSPPRWMPLLPNLDYNLDTLRGAAGRSPFRFGWCFCHTNWTPPPATPTLPPFLPARLVAGAGTPPRLPARLAGCCFHLPTVPPAAGCPARPPRCRI